MGHIAIIARELYIGCRAGRDYWKYVQECMLALEYKSCPVDPNVWIKPEKKGDTWFNSFVLLYMDDCLVISNRGEEIICGEIGQYFDFK